MRLSMDYIYNQGDVVAPFGATLKGWMGVRAFASFFPPVSFQSVFVLISVECCAQGSESTIGPIPGFLWALSLAVCAYVPQPMQHTMPPPFSPASGSKFCVYL